MECGDYVRLVFSLVLVSLAAVSMLIVLLFQFSKAACKQNGKFKRLKIPYFVKTVSTNLIAAGF